MTTERDPQPAPENSDPAADYRSRVERPGALRGAVWLTVETRQAQQLVNGRRKDDERPAIIGLTRFAALLRQLFAGARADDPYADWWLLKVHDALEASVEEIGRIRAAAKERLASVQAIDIAVAHSLEPVRIPLTFSHPYAFRGAYLVADFDETVRALLTVRHVGLMSIRESERLLDHAARAVRRAYLSPVGYKYLGITREDVAQGTARAQQAKELMGELPATILSSEQRAPYAPESQGGFRALNVHRPQRNSPPAPAAADVRPSPEAEAPAAMEPGTQDS